MSDLYSSYRKNLEESGFRGNPFLFLFFLFMWSLGYMLGICIVLLGVRCETEDELFREDIEEMVKTMNDQGPNN